MNIVSRIGPIGTAPISDKIDLKRLRYFIAVAEAGNFSRAAERLNVAQSHLSRQIMRLEATLGQRLFVRRARHVELTDAGQILLQETHFITSRLDGLPQRMNEAAGGSVGYLCIGLSLAECANSLTARVIGTLTRDEPQLSLRFCVEPRARLIEAIVDRRVQAGFARAPAIVSPEIRIDELVREPILLAVARTHRLAKREQIDLSEVAGEPFILCERGSAPEVYDDIMGGCQNAGFSPRVIFHAPQSTYALLLASAGIGVTLVPASECSSHADSLHFASLGDDIPNTSLVLITRTDEHMAGVKLLRKHALAAAALENAGRHPLGGNAGHR
ncbi:MAG: LysR family transcriptional regulator [Xanthobacteraceae bacterium]